MLPMQEARRSTPGGNHHDSFRAATACSRRHFRRCLPTADRALVQPGRSGSGMNIDIQDGTFVVTIYSYAADGSAQWYIASGKSTNDNHNFTGSLDKFRAGPRRKP